MSRFESYDDDGDDRYNGAGWAMWSKRAELALRGKRGRKALTELREALLALPDKRLIEGALCTVGINERLAAIPEKVEREITPIVHNEDGSIARDGDGNVIFEPVRTVLVENYERAELVEWVGEQDQPEGVCAIGAYVWFQKVKAGMDPAEAFAALPVLADFEGGGHETAAIGKEHGLTFTLAWELADRNDEQWGGLTPEQRYVSFLTWIDQELARPPLKAAPRREKRARRAKATAMPKVAPSVNQVGLGL